MAQRGDQIDPKGWNWREDFEKLGFKIAKSIKMSDNDILNYAAFYNDLMEKSEHQDDYLLIVNHPEFEIMKDPSKAALFEEYLSEPNVGYTRIVPGKEMGGLTYLNIQQFEGQRNRQTNRTYWSTDAVGRSYKKDAKGWPEDNPIEFFISFYNNLQLLKKNKLKPIYSLDRDVEDNYNFTENTVMDMKVTGDYMKKLLGEDVYGITTPLRYKGKHGGYGPIHVEDYLTWSKHLLIKADGFKIWIAVSPKDRIKLDNFLNKKTDPKKCHRMLQHKMVFPDPFELLKEEIEVTVGVHHEGQLMVTKPETPHYVINYGWSCGDAINFTTTVHTGHIERSHDSYCPGGKDGCISGYPQTLNIDLQKFKHNCILSPDTLMKSAKPSILEALAVNANQERTEKDEPNNQIEKIKNYCSICHIKFNSFQRFKAHRIKKHMTEPGQKPFKCTVEGCLKGYAEVRELKDHIRFKHDENPIICQICKQKYYSRYGFRIHKHHKQ